MSVLLVSPIIEEHRRRSALVIGDHLLRRAGSRVRACRLHMAPEWFVRLSDLLLTASRVTLIPYATCDMEVVKTCPSSTSFQRKPKHVVLQSHADRSYTFCQLSA